MPNEDARFLIPGAPTADVPAGGKHPTRLLVMAGCLTSGRRASILAGLEAGASTIDELAESLPDATGPERLVMLLRELRDAGFVMRSTEAGPPLRVSYRLTDDGRKLLDLTIFLSAWLSAKEEDESAARFWATLRKGPAAAARPSSSP